MTTSAPLPTGHRPPPKTIIRTQNHRYAPRAIAVVSAHPFFSAFTGFLHQLHAMVFRGQSPGLPIERVIQFFTTDVPRPTTGYVSIQFRCVHV